MLRASKYNFELPLEDGRLVLYNSKTGALATVEPSQSGAFNRVLRGFAQAGNEELVSQMTEQGFLFDDSEDELEDIKTWYSLFSKDQKLVYITMLPAEACNFACPYCFQFNKRNELMEPWVYDATYRFLENLVKTTKDKVYLRLSWFGGEPTLALRKIEEFQIRLKDLKDRYGLETLGGMVTNGYLLTKEWARRLVELGVKQFQVTIDGSKENHDSLRVLKSGAPTYERIYANLKAISTLGKDVDFEMAIRANFLKTSIDSMDELLNRYIADFGPDERFNLYFRPVYNFCTTRNDIEPLVPEICDLQEGLALQNRFAGELMRRLGRSPYTNIFDPLPKPQPAWCPAERDHTYIIGADGSIFICDTLVGDRDKRVGQLNPDGSMDLPGLRVWKSSVFELADQKCLDCKLLPVCMGGCRRTRLDGQRPCFWSEADVIRGMRQYANAEYPNLARAAGTPS